MLLLILQSCCRSALQLQPWLLMNLIKNPYPNFTFGQFEFKRTQFRDTLTPCSYFGTSGSVQIPPLGSSVCECVSSIWSEKIKRGWPWPMESSLEVAAIVWVNLQVKITDLKQHTGDLGRYKPIEEHYSLLKHYRKTMKLIQTSSRPRMHNCRNQIYIKLFPERTNKWDRKKKNSWRSCTFIEDSHLLVRLLFFILHCPDGDAHTAAM